MTYQDISVSTDRQSRKSDIWKDANLDINAAKLKLSANRNNIDVAHAMILNNLSKLADDLAPTIS